MKPIILASASPRRREILTLLGLPFEVKPASSELSIDRSLPLDKAVMQVARGKAEEIAGQFPDRLVIGSDTVVSIDGQILGKPADKQQAAAMLRRLQGREHVVYTGVWVSGPNGGDGFTDRAMVEFFPMTDDEIADYIETGEPMDKAGSYGIQGRGLRYIRCVQGDFYTVMGLPGGRLWHFLQSFMN